MKYSYDPMYTVSTFERIVNTPSTVSYYRDMNPVIVDIAASIGCEVTFDNKSTAYITLEGQDNSKTVLVGAHLDTIGMIVRRIDDNGFIRVRQLGGVNFHSLEGETVHVHTRDGKSYSGLVTVSSHSVHVFDDARSMERSEENMVIILDEDVHSKADVTSLGIRHGDIISTEPRFQMTENGEIKTFTTVEEAAPSEEADPTEDTTPDQTEPEEVPDGTVAGIPIAHIALFGGGLVVAVGALVGIQFYQKKRENNRPEDDDENDEI